jgi:hypothetical protein
MIVPDHVLADADVSLAVAVERDYELLGLWRYPEPEYSQFKQCVLLVRRRDKGLNKTRLTFPRWASEPTKWPMLRDDKKPVATLHPVTKVPTLRRTRLGNEIILDTLSRSPLRGGLLREAAAPAPPIGRPLLPLKAGHLALALAGGLCDGIIESGGNRFLIKGTLSSAIRRVSTKPQVDDGGTTVAEIDTYRTRYEMNVRCLRNDGSIENYTSAEPETKELEGRVGVPLHARVDRHVARRASARPARAALAHERGTAESAWLQHPESRWRAYFGYRPQPARVRDSVRRHGTPNRPQLGR